MWLTSINSLNSMTPSSSKETYYKSARRFADYYREYSKINKADFEVLAGEIDNIFSSVQVYRSIKAWLEVTETIQLIDDFLDASGYWEELIIGYQIAIECMEEHFRKEKREPTPEQWHQMILLRSQFTLLCFRRGEYQKAHLIATETMRIARQINHAESEALASTMLGAIAMAQGRYSESEQLLEDARGALDGKVLRKDVLLRLRQKGILADSQGELDEAYRFYQERTQLALDSQEVLEAAESLYNLGDIEQTRQKYAAAEHLYEQSQELYAKANFPRGLSNVLNRKAQLFIKTGRFDEATAILNQQLGIERQHGDQSSLLGALQDIASNLIDLGEVDLSKQYYEEAYTIASRLGDLPAQAISLQALGSIEQEKGNSSMAKEYLMGSLEAARRSGHPKLLDVVLSRLGILAWHEQDYQMARTCLYEVLRIELEIGRSDYAAQTLINLGDIEYEDQKFQAAEKNYNHAKNIYADIDNTQGLAVSLIGLSLVALRTKQYDQSWKLLVQSVDIGNLKDDSYFFLKVLEAVSVFIAIEEFDTQASKLATRISKMRSN